MPFPKGNHKVKDSLPNKLAEKVRKTISENTRVGPKDAQVSIYQKHTQVHMRLPIKIPKNHPLGFWIHPASCTGQGQPGVSQGHLEVPWEYQIGPKLKIYVKIMYSEHFMFF